MSRHHRLVSGLASVTGHPLIVHVDQDCADEPDHRCGIGEDPDHAPATLDLLVDPLKRVGRPDLAPVLTRERGEGEDLGFGFVHVGPDLGPPCGELVSGFVPRCVDVGGLGLGEDHPECRGHVVDLSLGDVGEQVPGEVDPASLMRDALERSRQCLDEAGVLVADDQLHAAQSSLFEGVKEPAPEDLVLAVADVQSEDLPVASSGDTGRDDHGH